MDLSSSRSLIVWWIGCFVLNGSAVQLLGGEPLRPAVGFPMPALEETPGVSDPTVAKTAIKARELKRPITSQRDVVFADVDGVKLKGDMFRPADDEVYPLVLMIHGGAWSSGDKWHLHDHARELAQAGFVAFTINYRLAPLHRFPAQIDDCRLALRWIVEQADEWKADRERLAVWGYSAGAHLAGLLVTRPQAGEPAIDAAVLGGAPCEFSFVPETSPVLASVMGGSRRDKPEIYRGASPLEFASRRVCPTFFFHGSSDLIVPYSSSQLLHQKLADLGVKSEYHLVEGRGHMLTFLDNQSRRLAIDFLQRTIYTPAEP